MTALKGLRVIDISSVVMGPYATRLLADLGAEVIKVEPPSGDVLRNADQDGALFSHLNRGKRGVVLDLKTPLGQSELRRLAADADVLVHNVRANAASRLGLRREDFAEVNTNLIVVCATGYGSDGPYAGRAAYDDLIQAASGMADIVGKASDIGTPAYVPLTLADRVVGLHIAFAIAAAVACRERTGIAQEIEVPMFEAFVDLVAGDHLGGLSFEPKIGMPHYPRLMSLHRRPYRTRDGWIGVLLYTDAHWRRFFALLGREGDLVADPLLREHTARQTNIDYAYGVVAEALTERSTAEWLAELSAADIPVAQVNDIASLLDDPHLHAVEFWRMLPMPDGTALRTTAPIGRWSATPPEPLRAPPSLCKGLRYDAQAPAWSERLPK